MEKSGYSAMRSSISCPMERAACCNAPAARRPTWRSGVARLGGDSGFIGRVGDDPFGRFMRHTLAQEQVDVNYMRLDAAQRTSTVVVDLDSHGERTFTFMVRPSADLFLQPEDLPPFAAGQWLHVCSIALSAEPSRSTTFAAMEAIKRAGGYVSFDPNIRSDLWQDPQDLRDCLDRALALADAIKLRKRSWRLSAAATTSSAASPAERPLPADATAGDPG